MKRPHATEWIIPVLNDVAEFLTANGMPASASAVERAVAAVRDDAQSGGNKSAGQPNTSEPVLNGNVLRFCVISGKGH